MHTSKVNNQVLCEHFFSHVDERHIRPHGVSVLVGCPVTWRFTRHTGAVALKRVFDIGIDGGAEALRLPVARHLDFVPLAYVIVLSLKSHRPFLRIAAPMELPLAVETDYLLALLPFRRQLQRGMIGQFVDAQHGGILPVGCGLSLSCQGQHGGYEDEDSFHLYFEIMVSVAVGRLLLMLIWALPLVLLLRTTSKARPFQVVTREEVFGSRSFKSAEAKAINWP